MTVSSTTNRKSFTGDGVTTSFGSSPVVFFNSSELVVQVIVTATGAATTLVENTNYTVSGGSGSTGTVNLAGGTSPNGAPSASQTLLIRRVLPLTQTDDFVNNDINDAEVTEDRFDKTVMQIQQLDEELGRGLIIPASETATDALTVLPFDRASKFLAFNASKELIASSGTVNGAVPVSAFMATVLDDTTAADARTTLGAAGSGAVTGSGLTMATSRLLGRTTAATGAIEEISVGSGLSLAGGTLSVQAALFPGVQQGLAISNNATDATNDIDVAAGKAVDTTAAVVMTLASTMVKRLDANWAAGTGNGGRYSGAAIANTTYHVWLVAKASGADVDVYLNPSADASTVLTNLQAESGGASYLYVWRIGSILRESAAIVPFTQHFAQFLRKASVLDVNITNSTTAAVTTTLSVPVGVKVEAFVNVNAIGDSGGEIGGVYLSPLDVNDAAASGSAAPLMTAGMTNVGQQGHSTQAFVRTNTSAQIRRRTVSAAGALTRIATLGWIDAGIYRS